MREIFVRKNTLTMLDVDGQRRLRLSALLGYLQHAATEHAISTGFGGDRMIADYRAMWLLVRTHLTQFRPIFVDDACVEVRTWCRRIDSAPIVLRDFDIVVNGNLVGEAITSWVLVDVDTRKIIKPNTIPELHSGTHPSQTKELRPQKVAMPTKMESVMYRPVYYSDTDINGHMNNIKYADIACDVLRYDEIHAQFISDVLINYLQESFPGDEITVLYAKEGERHYVRGADSDGRGRFDLRLSLSQKTSEATT